MFFSCTIEEYSENFKLKNETLQFALDSIPIIRNPYDAVLHTVNNEDKDDEKINRQLLEITILTTNYLKESAHHWDIYKMATESPKSTVNLYELVINSPITHTTAKLLLLLENLDFSYGNTNNEVEQYFPAIFVLNINSADFNKQPVICAGFEINTELPGMDTFEDYILAWYFDENDHLNEIIINEESAINTSNPVFIVIADIESENKGLLINSDPHFNKSGNITVKKIIDEYQINYRYDKSKRSEYSYEIAYNYQNGTTQYGGYRTEIAEIHKNNIGQIHTNNFEIWQINHLSNLYSVAIVTFEYDWYASKKSVMCGSLVLECRMSKANEFYQRFSVLMTSNITTNNDKGYIKVITQ